MLEYDFAIAMEQRWREQEIPSGISKVLCVILKVYRKYTGFFGSGNGSSGWTNMSI